MTEVDRALSAREIADDAAGASLRPRTFGDFVGQVPIVEQIARSIDAASRRGEALDHVLLAGPPGLGKTSLAFLIAQASNAPLVQTAGPSLERGGDIAALLTNVPEGAILFIDEMHRMPRALEEVFYPAMEDRTLPITVGEGAGARVVTLSLPPFTLVGATTRMGLLSRPLIDRFGIRHRLSPYGADDLAEIALRSARILGIGLTDEAAAILGRSSRGTPRIVNRLLRRVRDYAEDTIDEGIALQAMARLQIDPAGLDEFDRQVLVTMRDSFGGGPVGLSTLASLVGEEADTIEDVHEPYLLQRGFLQRTPRGRVISDAGLAHLASVGC